MEKPIQLNNCLIDSYTCTGNEVELRNLFTGRYCTIGNKVKFGLGFHNMEEFSTSAAMYKNNAIPSVNRENPFYVKTHHLFSYTILGHDVTIGDNSIFVNDLRIGDGAVIMPNSVVTRDIPPFAIVSGHNKIVGYRFSDEIISDLIATQWWNYDLPKMAQNGLKIPYNSAKDLIQFLKDTESKDLITFPSVWISITEKDKDIVISTISSQDLKQILCPA